MWRRGVTLNRGGDAEVTSLSCGSAGNCAAGGSYSSNGDQQAFVVSERNGSWARDFPPSVARTRAHGNEVLDQRTDLLANRARSPAIVAGQLSHALEADSQGARRGY